MELNLLDDKDKEDFVKESINWFKNKRSKYDKIGTLNQISTYFENLRYLSNKKYKPKYTDKDILNELSSSQITKLFNIYKNHYKKNKKNHKNILNGINNTHYQFLQLYDEIMKDTPQQENHIEENPIQIKSEPQNNSSLDVPDVENVLKNENEINNENTVEIKDEPDNISVGSNDTQIMVSDDENVEYSDDENSNKKGPMNRQNTIEINNDDNSSVEYDSDKTTDRFINDENEDDVNYDLKRDFVRQNRGGTVCDSCNKRQTDVYRHNDKNKDLDICITCLGSRTGLNYNQIGKGLKDILTRKEWNYLRKQFKN